MKNNNHTVDIQKYFLPFSLLFLLVLMAIFISPFLGTMLISAVIVTGVYPVHKLLHRKLRIPASFSAFISLVLVAVVLIVPLITLFFFVANEATGAYTAVSDKINVLTEKDIKLLPELLRTKFLDNIMLKINEYAPISTSDVITTAKDIVGKISSVILGQTTNILKNLSLFIVHLLVFLLSTFYFLRDGDKLVHFFKNLLPLSKKYRGELFNKLSRLSYGIIYGIFGAALAQGLLVGIGLAIVGVGNSTFWGAIAALFSPLPYIGTAVIWVPVVIALAIGGHWLSALFLLAWGAILVGMADNVVKPYLIGSSTALHPLSVLLVLLGGAFVFGLKGLIFGPFILTLTLSFLHIYSLEYKSVLKEQENRSP